MSKLRVALVMAGGGAAGKTTTTRLFALDPRKEHKALRVVETTKGMIEKEVVWTVCGNCAITGNYRSGTDSNTGPGLVRAAFFECLKVSDVVIVDGMISSPRWALMCNEAARKYPDFHVLLLHFDLSAEELLKRLAGRRQENPDSIRARMMPKCTTLVRRAQLLVEHFETKLDKAIPLDIVVVTKDMSPEQIVEEIDLSLEEIFREHGEEYYD